MGNNFSGFFSIYQLNKFQHLPQYVNYVLELPYPSFFIFNPCLAHSTYKKYRFASIWFRVDETRKREQRKTLGFYSEGDDPYSNSSVTSFSGGAPCDKAAA